MYKLVLRSNMSKAKQFGKWITNDVLPSIRKYGYYKLKKSTEEERDELLKKINYLEKQNKNMKNELKKDKFPDGGLVYALDYSSEDGEMYRIGVSNNMNNRKKIHDTHNVTKRKVVLIQQVKCPVKLEYCLRGMLYEYRYKNKKDVYVCNLQQLKKAFKTCLNSIDCMNQKGGYFNNSIIELKNKVTTLNNRIKRINKVVN